MWNRGIPALLPIVLCLSALVALLLLASDAAATEPPTRYVATTGIDSSSCTDPNSPCRTVQHAVDEADAGDVIKIATGVYSDVNSHGGLAQVVYISKTVTLRGGYVTPGFADPPAPAANPTTLDARGQSRVLYITGETSPTLEGLRITGGSIAGSGGGVFNESDQLAITHCAFISNSASFGGGIYSHDGPLTIRRSTFSGNSATSYGGGLQVYSEQLTLDGNVLAANTAGYVGGGLMLALSKASLVNNVLVDNQADVSGSGAMIYGSVVDFGHTTVARNSRGDGSGLYVSYVTKGSQSIHSTVTLTNTIVASQTVGIRVVWGSTGDLRGVLWFGNAQNTYASPGVITVTAERSGNPAFAPDGYHLTWGSAALDAGVMAGVVLDIDDQPRPLRGGYDLGADEWTPSVLVEPEKGATLVNTDTQGSLTVIEVPAGAVQETMLLEYIPVETSTGPSGSLFAGHAFALDAYQDGVLQPGFTFLVPVTITIHYTDADIDGLSEASLVLERWNEGTEEWEDAACGTCDRHPAANWLAVPVCHLSRFALFGARLHTIYLPLVLREAQ